MRKTTPKQTLYELRRTTFHDFGDLSQQVRLIAGVVPAKEKRPTPPLKPLHQAVLEIAPQHRRGLQTNIISLTKAVSERPELIHLSPEKRMQKIKGILTKLYKNGLIKTSTKQLAKLRDAEPAEIEANLHLVDQVLDQYRPNPMLAKRWQQHFNREEARSHGRQGLIRGLEVLDEAKLQYGEKSKRAYLKRKIASRIADEIERRAKQQRREQQIDESRPGTRIESASEKKRAVSSVEQGDAIRQLHSLHTKGVLGGHEVVILALRLMKRPQVGIGKHFNIVKSRVCQIESAAKHKIAQAYGSGKKKGDEED